MNELHWSTPYVGLPWRDRGRGPEGWDCWGLVRLVYDERLGIALPSYDEAYPSSVEGAEIERLIGRRREDGPWVEVSDPEPFDVILFRQGRHDSHVGLVVDRTHMLHMMEAGQSRIERFDTPQWSRRFQGFARHASRLEVLSTIRETDERIEDREAGGRALWMPVADPRVARLEVTFPQGATLAEIVAMVTPGLSGAALDRVRVVLVDGRGSMVVERAHWHLVRPKAGVRVIVRTVAGSGFLKSLLMIIITIAAIFLGQLWGLALGSALGIGGAAGTALITIGVGAIGMLLLRALFPPKKPEKEYGGYSISGWQNGANPDGPIPCPFGRLRFAPYYAVKPWTEIVGDVQYMRAAFVWGYGPATLSDLKFGDTSIDKFDDLEIEHRYGYPSDAQLDLITETVIEEGLSVELTRDWERNPDGSYKEGGHTIEKAESRFTATDVTDAAVIIGFPTGLCAYDKNGNRQNRAVSVRIRQRPLGTTTWQEVTTLSISAAKGIPFWRQYRWTLPERGAFEVELTRMTDESQSTNVSDRTVWQALQSYRPEYPIAFEHPLVLTALRVRATYQLNGQIDNFSGIFSRIAPDWDVATGTWITREARSPAAAFRFALEGPASAYPVSAAGVDLDGIADWAEFCAAKGLSYDRVHDQEESFADALTTIAGAGRAQPRHDGRRWGVVIDRPATLVVDHINPRNSRDFQWNRAYPRLPDGFRVKFQDSSYDWKPSERIIPWPGHVGDVVVTEQLELPGKCDPDEIWIEARRRQYEVVHRPDAFRVTQDGSLRVATRGDLVAVSYDTLDRTQVALRVERILGDLVVFDGILEMEAGTDYAIRFRVLSEADPIGESIVRPVATVAGEHRAVRLKGSGSLPEVGDIVHFGRRVAESLLAFVRAEERGEGGSVIFHLVAAAPEIDAATDAEVPPAWDGRAGMTYTGSGKAYAPAVPKITGVLTGASATGSSNGLVVHLAPGTGGAATVDHYEVDHRLEGASTWATATFFAADGGGEIDGYSAGATVELRARAVSLYGIVSDDGPVVSATIGATDTATPNVIAITVSRPTSGLRSFLLQTGTPTGSFVTIDGYRLRARPGSGWGWSDAAPLHSGLMPSPASLPAPIVAGQWTVLAVAVSAAEGESPNPYAVTVTLPALHATGTMASRIESSLGWPGTVTGGATSGGILVASAPGTLVYALPVIDLGSDTAVVVDADLFGVVGTATVAMRTGTAADGAPTGAAVPLGPVTARYVAISVTVTDSAAAPRLGDLATLVRTGT